jgi:hypothetical protein
VERRCFRPELRGPASDDTGVGPEPAPLVSAQAAPDPVTGSIPVQVPGESGPSRWKAVGCGSKTWLAAALEPWTSGDASASGFRRDFFSRRRFVTGAGADVDV